MNVRYDFPQPKSRMFMLLRSPITSSMSSTNLFIWRYLSYMEFTTLPSFVNTPKSTRGGIYVSCFSR